MTVFIGLAGWRIKNNRTDPDQKSEDRLAIFWISE